MIAVHRFIGLANAGIFLIIALMGLILWIRNKDAGPAFWNTLAAGQVGLAVQVLVGIFMFFTKGGMHWLHYAYGAFPILVLLYVHLKARAKDVKGLSWVGFAIAGFIIFGLQTRGFMTGLGM